MLPELPGLSVVDGNDRRPRPWSIAASSAFGRPTSSTAPPRTRTRRTGARTSPPTSPARSTSSRRRGARGVKRFINFQTALCYGRPERRADPGRSPAAPVHQLRHLEDRRRGLCRDQRPALGVAASRQCQRAAARDRADPDLLQAAQGRAGLFLHRRGARLPRYRRLPRSSMDIVLRDDAPTGIFNISTGEGHTIKEVFDAVAVPISASCRPSPSPVVPCGAGRCAGGRARPEPYAKRRSAGARRSDFAETIAPHAALVRRARRLGDLQPSAGTGGAAAPGRTSRVMSQLDDCTDRPRVLVVGGAGFVGRRAGSPAARIGTAAAHRRSSTICCRPTSATCPSTRKSSSCFGSIADERILAALPARYRRACSTSPAITATSRRSTTRWPTTKTTR